MLQMGKSTIWPFSIAMLVYQRVYNNSWVVCQNLVSWAKTPLRRKRVSNDMTQVLNTGCCHSSIRLVSEVGGGWWHYNIQHFVSTCFWISVPVQSRSEKSVVDAFCHVCPKNCSCSSGVIVASHISFQIAVSASGVFGYVPIRPYHHQMDLNWHFLQRNLIYLDACLGSSHRSQEYDSSNRKEQKTPDLGLKMEADTLHIYLVAHPT